MYEDAIEDITKALVRLADTYLKHDVPIPDQLSYSNPAHARSAEMFFHGAAFRGRVIFRVCQKSGRMDTEIAGFKHLWT